MESFIIRLGTARVALVSLRHKLLNVQVELYFHPLFGSHLLLHAHIAIVIVFGLLGFFGVFPCEDIVVV